MANEQSLALSIGEAARQSGVNIETIRFYERGGLLEAPPRTAGGHRVYDRARIKRLAFVRRGRELGFTLDEIRSRMADLARMETVLATMIERCAGGTAPDCPILETLFDGATPKPNPG